ncbi:hypothetical protein F183_A13220 [Bryobacterales bacterium F-183]|nr:hypothetical protein F183_A13220 [Bryobacterales bacterium F-183]
MLARVYLLCAIPAVIAYLPFQFLPPISDDYTQIALGRKYGALSQWADLAQDALYRCRATSILITHWTESLVGVSAPFLYATSLIVHILNIGLVVMLGSWRYIGWPIAIASAVFFAVHEGHQEAVVWYASLPELLVFTFTLLAILVTIRKRYAAAYAMFALALLSKESGVVFVPLFALILWLDDVPLPRIALLTTPFAITAALYTLAIFGAKQDHLHFNDGTFQLGPGFLTVLIISTGRLLWFWGVLALIVLALKRRYGFIAAGLVWIAITMLPYVFLTYMPRMPSRHTYLASLALAIFVGAAWIEVRQWRKPWANALVVIILAHNIGYLWYKKYPQYVRRAEPTEKLIEYSRERQAEPIVVRCFPFGEVIASDTLIVGAQRPRNMFRWDPTVATGYCDTSRP